HGRRLLYPSDRDYAQLSSLMATSRIVAVLDTEDDAQELVEAWGSRVSIFRFSFFTTSWDTAAENLLENNNALVLIGDSLSLLPIVQQNPDTLSIGPTWYDRQYLTFALPQNDVDFRRLVNYTLQEMLEDGSLNSITQPILVDGDTPPQIGIYPGSSEFLGINLSR
ncbi:MAG: transporter substrate-binding domain-containing protein, partial [Chloroflexota bacterium]